MSTGAGYIFVGRMNVPGCVCVWGGDVLCMLCGVCGCVGVRCVCGEVHDMVWWRCDVCEGVMCEYWVLWDVW